MGLRSQRYQKFHIDMTGCVALRMREADRGIDVDQATVRRRVIRLMPLPEKVFRRHKRPVGRRWRMDETYIKIRGQWKYLCRAVDSVGLTVDFLLTASRDKGP